ncbi:MAG: PaaI family thioesterase [Ottowia sp.]
MDSQTSHSGHSALYERIAASFARQGMMQHLGAQLDRVTVGEVELSLPYSDKVTQQQESFHGGVMGALADIAGGYAGLTKAPEGMEVVTVEYKINFLSSKSGGALRALGRVTRPGKRLIVTTAEVTHVADDGTTTPCALMQQTLAVVPKNY